MRKYLPRLVAFKAKILVKENETVAVRAVVAVIDGEGAVAAPAAEAGAEVAPLPSGCGPTAGAGSDRERSNRGRRPSAPTAPRSGKVVAARQAYRP